MRHFASRTYNLTDRVKINIQEILIVFFRGTAALNKAYTCIQRLALLFASLFDTLVARTAVVQALGWA